MTNFGAGETIGLKSFKMVYYAIFYNERNVLTLIVDIIIRVPNNDFYNASDSEITQLYTLINLNAVSVIFENVTFLKFILL